MRRAIGFVVRWRWLLAGLVCVASVTAQAQRVEGDRASAQGVYAAEVQVKGQGEAERNGAFSRALSKVLAKLTGDRGVASRPGVSTELRRARDYIDGYDYRQDEGVSANGTPTYGTTLVARFRQSEVDNIASSLGLPVWPEPRPKPVVWLAIDDGSGPRLVSLAQNNVARSVLDRAVERGYRLGLPSGSAAEQAAAGAIWRGDTAAVARLSARYSPPMQLIGKLRRGMSVKPGKNGVIKDAKINAVKDSRSAAAKSGRGVAGKDVKDSNDAPSSTSGWTADWIFVDGGRVLSSWSTSDVDARRAMAGGADGAADAMMRKYAKSTSAGPAGKYRVIFTGLRSGDDFIRLSALLQRTAVVRGITPVRATPDSVEMDLDLLTGLSGFRRMIGNDTLIEVGGATEANGPIVAPVVFNLR